MSTDATTMTAFEQTLRSRLSARRAIADIERLVECGDRFVGSAGDREAAAFVRTTFEQLGLEVEERPFETVGYAVDDVDLRLDGDERSIDAIPAYFAPGTSGGPIEAPVISVGTGTEAEYDGIDVAGRIVVIQEQGLGYGRFWMGTFAAMAARRGAIAVIVVHPLPWAYRMSIEAGNGALENRFLDEQIPVVSISAIDGLRVFEALGRGGARARLSVVSQTPDVASVNISGVLRGTDLAHERVVVHAHRDHGISPGANDNGSGLGTMLEIARALHDTQPRRSIEFLCTTAEEGVTKGVAAYIEARESAGDLATLRAAIDLDMFGGGGKLNLVDRGHWPDCEPIVHSQWMNAAIEELADELGYDVSRMVAEWGVAESGRFIDAGVPAIWFWKPDDFYYHSVHDSVDKIDGNSLKAVADLTTITLWRLAGADTLQGID